MDPTAQRILQSCHLHPVGSTKLLSEAFVELRVETEVNILNFFFCVF